jgi:hypothetical protein
MPMNYYNMLGYNNFVIRGKIVDKKTGKPIEGAVIRGYDKNWTNAWHTFTNEKGEFSLYSNSEYRMFSIAAAGYYSDFIRYNFKYNKIGNVKFDLNNLPDEDAEYHKISYQTRLNKNPKSPFDFNPNNFNDAKFEGKMETIKLQKFEYGRQ